MNQYIAEITSRLAEPQAGINASWEIYNGRVGLAQSLRNWRPPADAPSLIVTIFRWAYFAPLFYLAVAPAFLIYLLFASVCAFLD
ncbi:hypothetical protein ANO14919_093950 [Xylariales sp. No.14919]|nr:hypothetical protein ANO14919_093950 [Xylariales sp. No.14919]